MCLDTLSGAGRHLSWDDDPPLPTRQQEVPGTHQVGISVKLATGVFTRGYDPSNMIGKI